MYYKRIADKILERKLKTAGAVLITGPKWCGKSTTAAQIAKSKVYLQNIETSAQDIELAKNAPRVFLKGKTPKLIDEWQIIPFIWDAIRSEIDQRNALGQFLLTGSAVPADFSSIQHSGIGRIVTYPMRTMSLFESFDSNGIVSLENLFNGKEIESGENKKQLEEYAFLTCRGGWPSAVGKDEHALDLAFNYFDGLINSDISRFDKVRRDPIKARLVLRSLARNVGTSASIAVLFDDINNDLKGAMSESTLISYIEALRGLFVIEDMGAWSPNLRSKSAIRTTPTRYFTDPSIATAALGIGPDNLINDMNTFGFLFENMCIRDLRVYAEKIGGKVLHFRNKSGFEVDAIVELRNGDWGAIEIKLRSEERINEGADNLLKLASLVDETKMKRPSFLMVLTATDYAYRRADGVYVVPIGCLKD